MKIIIAKDAGYCFGVRDAVNLAYDTAKEFGSVYMLGDIVHNEKVVDDLNNAGAKVVNDINKIPLLSFFSIKSINKKNNIVLTIGRGNLSE